MNITVSITPGELNTLLEGFAGTVTAQVVAALGPSIDKENKAMAAIDDEITALTATVANDATVEGSAVTLINGFGAQITAAVNQALAAGATPAQLAGITAANTALQANSTALAAAVANVPPAAGAPSNATQTAA